MLVFEALKKQIVPFALKIKCMKKKLFFEQIVFYLGPDYVAPGKKKKQISLLSDFLFAASFFRV
jgi:hypothetical protein